MSAHIGKSDPELGARVEGHLRKLGIHTPTLLQAIPPVDKLIELRESFATIMEVLGLDLEDDSLRDTPQRVAKMFLHEQFWGLDPKHFPKCTTVENKMNYNNSFVLEKGITVHSVCEHHFVTIDGLATIAYIPHQKVLGLSKLNRIAQYFAHRPQVQERLTEQIAETLSLVVESPDVAVYIDAKHYCVASRGISDTNSSTVTLSTRGAFAKPDSEVRREFLAIARAK